MRIIALAAAVMLAAAPASAHDTWYRSTDGSSVHVPYREAQVGETAVCGDGTHSMSHHHRGTCSHHHGVARWER